MRLRVGWFAGEKQVFLLKDGQAASLSKAYPGLGPDLSALIGDPEFRSRIATDGNLEFTIDAAGIQPAMPLEKLGKIICIGLNYVAHAEETKHDVPDYPALFLRVAESLVPAGQAMIRPQGCSSFDYEAELMVIVGKEGRRIPVEKALEHVFGYTVFNDGSVREAQFRANQWTPGKNFDGTGAVGPNVVTPDELPEGAKGLRISCRVGDEILQDANTDDMIWSVAEAISLLSEFTTLKPGDLVAMGTPPGVGFARKPQRWLEPGEVVEVEVEGIGVCQSPVTQE